ncbi:hypothetical protein Egran_05991 [Elaphomyces granulatus]|uniref:Peptidase S7 domain-containing protein n=1 Tax=Elaphomyces granulatus TaxID=519963 RepID=A0A232LPZ6_9EURO|nr:hypothetical protein Egran_05991 [Elaphomyces granulatus]
MATIFRRSNRGSETELSYASPAPLRLLLVAPSPSHAGDGRRRKNRGSSDDSGAELSDENQQGRVVHLLEKVNSILLSHEVAFQSVDMCGRRSRVDPELDVSPTVLVLARRNALDKSWLNACRDIRAFLAKENLSSFNVEIADERAFELPRYSPVLPSDAIFCVWDKVWDQILMKLDLKDIVCIECFRMGTSDNPKENPPTVILTVIKQSARDWRQVREAVVGVLNYFNLPMVGVSIGPGNILRQDGGWIEYPLDAYQDAAQAGVSLGIHGSALSAGTFAGWVEIKDPRTGEWTKLGLTCFHCVDPGSNSVSSTDLPQLQQWHKNSVVPGDQNAERLLKLDQPRQKDIQRELDEIEENLRSTADDEFGRIETAIGSDEYVTPREMRKYTQSKQLIQTYVERKTMILDFVGRDKHLLGHVFSASGYREAGVATIRSDTPTILDWALISPRPWRSRSDNAILNYGSPPPSMPLPPDLRLVNWDDQDLKGVTKVYKAGRSTGYTAGEYSHLNTVSIATVFENGKPKPKITTEHSITGRHGQPFSLKGDSGAFVFTQSGEVIGVVFAGHEQRPVTYFTHIADVFSDIKQKTGATEVRIYES